MNEKKFIIVFESKWGRIHYDASTYEDREAAYVAMFLANDRDGFYDGVRSIEALRREAYNGPASVQRLSLLHTFFLGRRHRAHEEWELVPLECPSEAGA